MIDVGATDLLIFTPSLRTFSRNEAHQPCVFHQLHHQLTHHHPSGNAFHLARTPMRSHAPAKSLSRRLRRETADLNVGLLRDISDGVRLLGRTPIWAAGNLLFPRRFRWGNYSAIMKGKSWPGKDRCDLLHPCF